MFSGWIWNRAKRPLSRYTMRQQVFSARFLPLSRLHKYLLSTPLFCSSDRKNWEWIDMFHSETSERKGGTEILIPFCSHRQKLFQYTGQFIIMNCQHNRELAVLQREFYLQAHDWYDMIISINLEIMSVKINLETLQWSLVIPTLLGQANWGDLNCFLFPFENSKSFLLLDQFSHVSMYAFSKYSHSFLSHCTI